MIVDIHERQLLLDGNSLYKSIILVRILSDTLIAMEGNALLLPQ
jgi:hypothetical protein